MPDIHIRVIIVGGTIDKVYDPIKEELIFMETHVPAMLQQARCWTPSVKIEPQVVRLMDSLKMEPGDYDAVRDACIEAPEERVVITHGTSKLVQTAQIVASAVADKTVVLVGAMVPWTFGNSDSMFNLGAAITAVQLLQGGVWITMSGGIFPWNGVQKNEVTGIFEAT